MKARIDLGNASAPKVARVSRPHACELLQLTRHFCRDDDVSIGPDAAIDVCVDWVVERAIKSPKQWQIEVAIARRNLAAQSIDG